MTIPSRDDAAPRRRIIVIGALGIAQIFAWGTSFYLLAVLAGPIAASTGWSLSSVVGGMSVGLLVSGLASPRVGGIIARRGGRPVLAASAMFLSAGLAGVGAAQHLVTYFAAWILIGLGMGAGLYDPVFATLGRLYGGGARSAITGLTLFGGFASTVCWPLSAYLEATLGWRGTCFAYGGFHLAVTLPLYLFALAREKTHVDAERAHPDAGASAAPSTNSRPQTVIFVLLAAAVTTGAAISSLISAHLPAILQSYGASIAAAVALGALVGPSQVGARVVEILFGRFHHPAWTKLASTTLIAAGISALWSEAAVLPLTLIMYGAGLGLQSIARGTLPLVLFERSRYPVLMGRLALPSLLATAASPSLGAIMLERFGASSTIATLAAIAIANVILVLALMVLIRANRPPRAA